VGWRHLVHARDFLLLPALLGRPHALPLLIALIVAAAGRAVCVRERGRYGVQLVAGGAIQPVPLLLFLLARIIGSDGPLCRLSALSVKSPPRFMLKPPPAREREGSTRSSYGGGPACACSAAIHSARFSQPSVLNTHLALLSLAR